MNSLEILRMFLCGLFILFVPGLAWSYIFFAKKNIDWIERVALSFGLSIALVPISVFWLHFLFDMKITLLSTSATVGGLIALAAVYIFARRHPWGRNVTSRLRSVFGHRNGKQNVDPAPPEIESSHKR